MGDSPVEGWRLTEQETEGGKDSQHLTNERSEPREYRRVINQPTDKQNSEGWRVKQRTEGVSLNSNTGRMREQPTPLETEDGRVTDQLKDVGRLSRVLDFQRWGMGDLAAIYEWWAVFRMGDCRFVSVIGWPTKAPEADVIMYYLRMRCAPSTDKSANRPD